VKSFVSSSCADQALRRNSEEAGWAPSVIRRDPNRFTKARAALNGGPIIRSQQVVKR
jgi:hypothetical protein